MQSKFNLIHCIGILYRTPLVLNDLLKDLDESWLIVDEGPETWSPIQIIAHLIYGEKTDWIPRARIILNDGGAFEAFDRFAHLDEDRTINELLTDFEDLRNSNLQILKSWNLSHRELQLKGIHPDFGNVTLQELIASWTVHDLVHVNQITRVMAKHYKGEVGPFKNYMSLLRSVE